MYRLSDYDYVLPAERIAQVPASCRDRSRLMVLERKPGRVGHHLFSDLVDLLLPGDLLVINDTRVVPGRLYGRKETGGKIEILLVDYPGNVVDATGLPGERQRGDLHGRQAVICTCLTKASKPPRQGSKIFFPAGLTGTVIDGGQGVYTMAFHCSDGFDEALESVGEIPLPPYIRRNRNASAACNDREAYQTVYAQKKGAVAAPTAGLHFSPTILTCLERKGVRIVPLTLHVGYGTFLPVRVSDIRQHKMHSEWYELTASTASAVNDAKAEGRRVVAVGTTVVRVLEHRVDNDGRVRAGTGSCNLFIYPGFRFRVIDAMITNFHLPESTLLMLVCAFAGREFVLKAYREAVDEQYRFFSYGDATFIC